MYHSLKCLKHLQKEIEYACKYYFEKSKKATTIEAIQRYLTAIDQFYKYIKERDITGNKNFDKI